MLLDDWQTFPKEEQNPRKRVTQSRGSKTEMVNCFPVNTLLAAGKDGTQFRIVFWKGKVEDMTLCGVRHRV
jgi:hypothetical protein